MDLFAARDEIYAEVRSGARKRLRASGHRLTVEWSGEYGYESSSTGTCTCGWAESGGSEEVVREEYRWHLIDVLARKRLEET